MKNLKRIFQLALFSLGFFFSLGNMEAQTISNKIFGQNAWMPDSVGSMVLNGKLHQHWGNIKSSGAVIVRFGGIAPDKNKPTNYQYIKMIDSIRAKGMEPIIQVPFHKWQYSAQDAAEIVKFINVTKGKNIKYWSIGNEPDLDYAYTNASQVAAYIKPFASAMKAVDPSILIMGPECAWFNQNIIDGLTTPNGPDDITGKDAAGRYYLDIVSFHFYGFDGTQTRAGLISKINSPNGFNDNLAYLNSRLASCNTAHNRSAAPLKIAVTEANVNWKNDGGDNLNGVGANSFVGAQFIAEMMGTAMKHGVEILNIWSVIEGNNTSLNIGYLDASTGAKKPAYYHFRMLAENFKGNYVSGTSNNANVKVFGSKSGEFTNVMILNQDLANNFSYTVRLNNSAVSGNSALKINMNAGLGVEYSGVMQGQSTLLLTFNAAGALVKKTEYTMLNHAVNGLAPVSTDHNGTVVNNGLVTGMEENSDVISMKGFNMNVFPNPSKGKFVVELDRPNQQDLDFKVEVYDIMGRLIHTSTSTFGDRQQVIDLSGNSIATAVYIIKVQEAGDKDNSRTRKIVVFKS